MKKEEMIEALRAEGYTVSLPPRRFTPAERLAGQEWHLDEQSHRLFYGPATDEDTDDYGGPLPAATVRPASTCSCCSCHRWTARAPRWDSDPTVGIAKDVESAREAAMTALYRINNIPREIE